MRFNFFYAGLLVWAGCTTQTQTPQSIHQIQDKYQKDKPKVNLSTVRLGLDVLLDDKIELIKNKSIGLVTNNSGIDNNGVSNYERLMKIKDISIKVIFSPEHGLFGEAAAGEKVNYNGQIKTLPKIVSLYGDNRKPTQTQMEDIDIIIYDIQDIGARFYTYISTLGMVMESASKHGVKVLVLDRPNPIGGNIIEGPILDLKFQTFVGYYPIPTRYGLTIGELALMINGEKWIDGNPELEIVKMKGWTRDLWYDQTKLPWVKPSPNIPDLNTAIIYPGMCLLEATNISEGRGTKKPFKKFGAPWINKIELSKELNNLNLPGVVFKPITFIPTPIKGMSNNPKYKNQVCHGAEIIVTNREKFNSVRTGMRVIDKIKEKYPTHLKIKTSGMNRLWGNAEFSFQASTNNINQFYQPLKIFNNRSKKYYLYE
ncbi:MAG: hypothetical protein CMG58_04115 [Candidatus Marinimicrobia bacterium]|nr:hypothetical protein [Candidatus Neomarinimicrobiota bacterium]|tara:strand:- start:10259 stop:11539 length:1281 start_codon:yes stop_codon:yes gene_type:complete